MASDTDELVEVVYESGGGREITHETEPDRPGGFPSIVVRAGRVFRLVREEIVSRGGELTHLRILYRQK
jgi:hypothetical protein